MDTDTEVFVRLGGQLISIGTGYSNVAEIEEQIDEQFGAGDYEYGAFDSWGEHDVAEPTYEGEDIDSRAERVLNELENVCNHDDRVNGFSRTVSPTRKYYTSLNTSNIRYTVYEVDFAVTINNDVFSDVPISTFDTEVEQDLISLLNELSEEVVFLGFDSGYVGRGRQEPYVTIYGRAYRDTTQDKEIRGLSDHDAVETVLWNNENLSPVPILTKEGFEYNEEDVIVVLSQKTDDSLEEIGSVDIEWLASEDPIGDCETLRDVWVGKILYGPDTERHLCIGIQTTEKK